MWRNAQSYIWLLAYLGFWAFFFFDSFHICLAYAFISGMENSLWILISWLPWSQLIWIQTVSKKGCIFIWFK